MNRTAAAARLPVLLLSTLLATACAAKPPALAPKSPWPRQLEDVARRGSTFHEGALWVLEPGKVDRIDVASGARTPVPVDSGTIALHRTLDDRLWTASHRDGLIRVFELRQGSFVSILETKEPSRLWAATEYEGRPALLCEGAILTVRADGTIRRTPLEQNLLRATRVIDLAFAITESGVAFVGLTSVPWDSCSHDTGGSLDAIDLASGQLRRVGTGGVTGVVADPDRRECAIVADGDPALGGGSLSRVCGGQSEELPAFTDVPAVPPPAGRVAALLAPWGPAGEKPRSRQAAEWLAGGTVLQGSRAAILGLVRTRRGYWARSPERVLHVVGSRRFETTLPAPTRRGGTSIAYSEGLLVEGTAISEWDGDRFDDATLVPLTLADDSDGPSQADRIIAPTMLLPPRDGCWNLAGARRWDGSPGGSGASEICFEGDTFHLRAGKWEHGQLQWLDRTSDGFRARLSPTETLLVRGGNEVTMIYFEPVSTLVGRRATRAADHWDKWLREDFRKDLAGRSAMP